MGQRRIMIAGTGSGAGKTTVTIGLMAAFQAKGLQVQGFKCGPDYIDPAYHTAVTGRPSRNLDSWMIGNQHMKDIYSRAEKGADISIIEGVMGYFDGKDPLSNHGSSADISEIVDCPVLLVINGASMARSAAAIVKGFQAMAAPGRIAGVIVNRVGSEGHFQLIQSAIEKECGIPALGYLIKQPDIAIPERHLGLVPSVERGELDSFFCKLGELIAATVDLEAIWHLADSPVLKESDHSIFAHKKEAKVSIAVARDAAFNFYYEENLELLEANGARLRFFSPLKDEPVPRDAAGLYIGGGFPEEFAEELAKNERVKSSIRSCIAQGMPTLAECGGFMYLTEAIEDTSGVEHPMAGVIPGKAVMKNKRTALGYREWIGLTSNFLLPKGETARGHVFHYSNYIAEKPVQPAYQSKGRSGIKEEGYATEQLLAGYAHFHFASNPALAERFVHAAENYPLQRMTGSCSIPSC
ncbi:cobyrinate a,c-diamide synthase [Bacillus xiapuensis]|uniref:cobyrinate a,c-diamide synthase n=1 Tax=Bacillus xiapuensis TaxID=2014075 RepID=UPI000C243144|nr:cobyrinate a,c-diamide synthase [Bacillus xiapuensis]